ncbi:MAG: PaaI family thioesterase [Pseudomonadota bacterium]
MAVSTKSADSEPGAASATQMTRDQVAAYIEDVFPEANAGTERFVIEDVRAHGARVRMTYDDRMIRPGATISGPAMFTLADIAMYVAILANIGRVPLAVTTSATINFLRRPLPQDMIAEVNLIKLGRRLAVGDVRMYSVGDDRMVAQANATYSLPPDRTDGR